MSNYGVRVTQSIVDDFLRDTIAVELLSKCSLCSRLQPSVSSSLSLCHIMFQVRGQGFSFDQIPSRADFSSASQASYFKSKFHVPSPVSNFVLMSSSSVNLNTSLLFHRFILVYHSPFWLVYFSNYVQDVLRAGRRRKAQI